MEPKEIVKAAWHASGMSQVRFAKLLNKSQPMLSKYLSGGATPPAEVIILCMNSCGLLQTPEISASMLAKRIERELSGPSFASTRAAINQILDSIAGVDDTMNRQRLNRTLS